QIPPPLSLMERTWQNYGKAMKPDDVLHHEATWGAAQRLNSAGMGEPEAFAHVANNLWERMRAPHRITPTEARDFMAAERQAYDNGGFDVRGAIDPLSQIKK